MRILLLAPGNTTHTQRFVRLAISSGHQVFHLDKNPISDKLFAGYNYYRYYQLQWLNFARPHSFRAWLKLLLRVIHIRLISSVVKPDITHVLGIDSRAYQCALAKLHPLVLTSWGSDINDLYEREEDAVSRKQIAYALRCADHVTADTFQLLERCNSLSNQPLLASIFYFGIDFELFRKRSYSEIHHFRQTLDIQDDVKLIVSARRLIPKMNHDLIISAFTQVLKELGPKFILVLRRYGSYSKVYADQIIQIVNQFGVSDHILWLDQMDYAQVPLLYSSSDLIVNYPSQDGLPVTLFEASACMAPVVTSMLGAYADFLTGNAYYLAEPCNTSSLSAAMKTALTEPEPRRNNRLKLNYELVSKVADQHQCFQGLESVYSNLLDVPKNLHTQQNLK